MKAVIIEDELLAAERLSEMIVDLDSNISIEIILDSIESTVVWFNQNPNPDIIFMDIQLADGLSFSIFSKCNVTAPVIFTTAFDQYSLKAFKVNSIDYLLKPINEKDLKFAINKFKDLQTPAPALNQALIEDLIKSMRSPEYKKRFLVKNGKELVYVPTDDAAYFYSEDGMTFLKSKSEKRFIIDYTIEQVEQELDPQYYFRISRKIIVQVDSIQKIHPFFSGRLKLDLIPKAKEDVTVSRDRVGDFKDWLNR